MLLKFIWLIFHFTDFVVDLQSRIERRVNSWSVDWVVGLLITQAVSRAPKHLLDLFIVSVPVL